MDEDQVNEEQGNEPERQEVTFTDSVQISLKGLLLVFLLFVEKSKPIFIFGKTKH